MEITSQKAVNAFVEFLKLRSDRLRPPYIKDEKEGVSYLDKDEIRDQLIALVSVFLAMDIDGFECNSVDSGSAGCCQAINGLFKDLASGGSGWAAANEVLAVCAGIG
jgi:hypothetical protein